MKSPSWSIVITAGVCGGIVNWNTQTELWGWGVFCILTALLMWMRAHRLRGC